MEILRGFLILIGFFLAGELTRLGLGLPFSGGVLGMLGLVLFLMARGRASEGLAAASQSIISVLVLLIMPGVVGIFFNVQAFNGYWIAILSALILGTLLSVVSTLLLMQWAAGGDSGKVGQ
ncbi:CidA/LrgA family protein [Marinobacter confluentis]|uniref:CidA/LrgA family protein n=1 Tax=Marinobacter confluentis TaxID=1697557 RepID=A0A4Z1BXS2_9GAMM|nr:CidA/LrgA family protein [Marinobacter confluentis]TGN38070.1 CidA/LrgA family protein [Marinobacter confluentis]